MSKKYNLPENEQQMVSEPVAMAYNTSDTNHVNMSFDIPRSYDKESFRLLMMVYANQLIQNADKHNRALSDSQLAEELKSLPDFNESLDTVTPVLTKSDYKNFMRVRKPMKGIAKWL